MDGMNIKVLTDDGDNCNTKSLCFRSRQYKNKILLSIAGINHLSEDLSIAYYTCNIEYFETIC